MGAPQGPVARTVSAKGSLQAKSRLQATRISAPLPVNLPSRRRENAGLDPNIALVPSGSAGWGTPSALASANSDSSPLEPKTPADAPSSPPVPKPAWAPVGPVKSDLLKEFPTAAEAALPPATKATAKPVPSSIFESRANVGEKWDEMVDDRLDFSADVLEFGNEKVKVAKPSSNVKSVKPDEAVEENVVVSKQDRFSEDYDRSYPPNRVKLSGGAEKDEPHQREGREASSRFENTEHNHHHYHRDGNAQPHTYHPQLLQRKYPIDHPTYPSHHSERLQTPHTDVQKHWNTPRERRPSTESQDHHQYASSQHETAHRPVYSILQHGRPPASHSIAVSHSTESHSAPFVIKPESDKTPYTLNHNKVGTVVDEDKLYMKAAAEAARKRRDEEETVAKREAEAKRKEKLRLLEERAKAKAEATKSEQRAVEQEKIPNNKPGPSRVAQPDHKTIPNLASGPLSKSQSSGDHVTTSQDFRRDMPLSASGSPSSSKLHLPEENRGNDASSVSSSSYKDSKEEFKATNLQPVDYDKVMSSIEEKLGWSGVSIEDMKGQASLRKSFERLDRGQMQRSPSSDKSNDRSFENSRRSPAPQDSRDLINDPIDVSQPARPRPGNVVVRENADQVQTSEASDTGPATNPELQSEPASARTGPCMFSKSEDRPDRGKSPSPDSKPSGDVRPDEKSKSPTSLKLEKDADGVTGVSPEESHPKPKEPSSQYGEKRRPQQRSNHSRQQYQEYELYASRGRGRGGNRVGRSVGRGGRNDYGSVGYVPHRRRSEETSHPRSDAAPQEESHQPAPSDMPVTDKPDNRSPQVSGGNDESAARDGLRRPKAPSRADAATSWRSEKGSNDRAIGNLSENIPRVTREERVPWKGKTWEHKSKRPAFELEKSKVRNVALEYLTNSKIDYASLKAQAQQEIQAITSQASVPVTSDSQPADNGNASSTSPVSNEISKSPSPSSSTPSEKTLTEPSLQPVVSVLPASSEKIAVAPNSFRGGRPALPKKTNSGPGPKVVSEKRNRNPGKPTPVSTNDSAISDVAPPRKSDAKITSPDGSSAQNLNSSRMNRSKANGGQPSQGAKHHSANPNSAVENDRGNNTEDRTERNTRPKSGEKPPNPAVENDRGIDTADRTERNTRPRSGENPPSADANKRGHFKDQDRRGLPNDAALEIGDKKRLSEGTVGGAPSSFNGKQKEGDGRKPWKERKERREGASENHNSVTNPQQQVKVEKPETEPRPSSAAPVTTGDGEVVRSKKARDRKRREEKLRKKGSKESTPASSNENVAGASKGSSANQPKVSKDTKNGDTARTEDERIKSPKLKREVRSKTEKEVDRGDNNKTDDKINVETRIESAGPQAEGHPRKWSGSSSNSKTRVPKSGEWRRRSQNANGVDGREERGGKWEKQHRNGRLNKNVPRQITDGQPSSSTVPSVSAPANTSVPKTSPAPTGMHTGPPVSAATKPADAKANSSERPQANSIPSKQNTEITTSGQSSAPPTSEKKSLSSTPSHGSLTFKCGQDVPNTVCGVNFMVASEIVFGDVGKNVSIKSLTAGSSSVRRIETSSSIDLLATQTATEKNVPGGAKSSNRDESAGLLPQSAPMREHHPKNVWNAADPPQNNLYVPSQKDRANNDGLLFNRNRPEKSGGGAQNSNDGAVNRPASYDVLAAKPASTASNTAGEYERQPMAMGGPMYGPAMPMGLGPVPSPMPPHNVNRPPPECMPTWIDHRPHMRGGPHPPRNSGVEDQNPPYIPMRLIPTPHSHSPPTMYPPYPPSVPYYHQPPTHFPTFPPAGNQGYIVPGGTRMPLAPQSQMHPVLSNPPVPGGPVSTSASPSTGTMQASPPSSGSSVTMRPATDPSDRQRLTQGPPSAPCSQAPGGYGPARHHPAGGQSPGYGSPGDWHARTPGGNGGGRDGSTGWSGGGGRGGSGYGGAYGPTNRGGGHGYGGGYRNRGRGRP